MPNEFGRLNINFKPVIPLVPHIPVDAAVPIDLGGIQQGTPLSGTSTKNDVAGVTGRHGSITAAVDVVPGQAPIQAGVYGSGRYGVQGESKNQGGVWGNNSGGGYGVVGTSDKPNGIGVLGRGAQLGGMFDGGVGVWGTSKTWMGVYGTSESTTGGAGVMGESTTGGGAERNSRVKSCNAIFLIRALRFRTCPPCIVHADQHLMSLLMQSHQPIETPKATRVTKGMKWFQT